MHKSISGRYIRNWQHWLPMKNREEKAEGRLYIAHSFLSLTYLTMWMYYSVTNKCKQEKVTSMWNKFWGIPGSKKANEFGLTEKSEQKTLQFKKSEVTAGSLKEAAISELVNAKSRGGQGRNHYGNSIKSCSGTARTGGPLFSLSPFPSGPFVSSNIGPLPSG